MLKLPIIMANLVLFTVLVFLAFEWSFAYYIANGTTFELHDVKYDNRSRAGNFGWKNCPGCGVIKRTRIVGGRAASIQDYPWTVSLKKNGQQHCGGAVLNRNFILTAAHCIKGHDMSKIEVIAAVDDVTSRTAIKLRVASAEFHQQFEAETYDFDVGVMRLQEPLPLNRGIKYVCLPNPEDDPTGQTGVVAGWGAAKETDNFGQNKIRSLGVPIVSNAECRRATGMKDQKVTERMMCAGYVDGSMDACTGDSGGPLIWYNSGYWKQVGIVSWGVGCARPNFYGVYTRATTMLSWISKHASQGEC